MKVILPSVEMQFTGNYIDEKDIYKKIEKIARTCYKSEDKITETSHEKMIDTLRERGHWAMFEHHNIVRSVSKELYIKLWSLLNSPDDQWDGLRTINETARCQRYFNFTAEPHLDRYLISGSPTAFANMWVTNNKSWNEFCEIVYYLYPKLVKVPSLFEPMKFNPNVNRLHYDILDPIQIKQLPYDIRKYHEMVTFKVIMDRGVSHEAVRHRPMAFAQESTRYCNYGNSGVTFILPNWFNEHDKLNLLNERVPMTWDRFNKLEDEDRIKVIEYFNEYRSYQWYVSMLHSENTYNLLVSDQNDERKWQPQEARSILPNSLKTEIYMSATLQQWEWFCNMRTPTAAHPQMREIAIPIKEKLFKYIYPNRV